MIAGQLLAIVARDRAGIDRLLEAVFAGRSLPGVPADALAGMPGPSGRRCFCVQRYPKFLEDHTIVDNWSLPLWEIARQDADEWCWLQEEAKTIMSRYTPLPAQAYPAQLDDVARVAASFAQAHLLLPDLLLLDALFSDWHRSDRDRIGCMLRDYHARHPLRPVLHIDVAPPPAILPFHVFEVADS